MLGILLAMSAPLLLGWVVVFAPAVSGAPGPTCGSANVKCLVGRGVMHDSALDLTEVLWVGPETSKVYVGSPSIWKDERSGRCFTSHDFFGSSTLDFTVQVFVDDSGCCAGPSATWRYTGNVSGIYWANLFMLPPAAGAQHAGLYLLGTSQGDGAHGRSIVLGRSLDGGASWNTPTTLVRGGQSALTNYHGAPTPTLLAPDGRLYRAFDSEWGGPPFSALMLRTRAPLRATADILDPAAWELSPALPFNQSAMVPASWGPSSWKSRKWSWQEPNAVEMPDGSVGQIFRIDGQTSETHNKAALLRLEPDSFRLRFERMLDFPSTSSKFVVRRAPSGSYYTISSSVTPRAVQIGSVGARNHLVLGFSPDAIRWTVCWTLLIDDSGFDALDSARYTGFHYVDFVFDGADLVYAVRTGYRGANSFHNANRLTTKRLSDYGATCARGLAWQDEYERVGRGWCRPIAGFRPAAEVADERECAQRCGEWALCAGFAINGSSCALYPLAPNSPSGTGNFSCWRRKPAP